MTRLTHADVHDDVLDGLRPPRPAYYLLMLVLAGFIGLAVTAWVYQVKNGMGVAGINHPVGWGVYIANFVFWVGIAHSGTLISAILHLVRSRWRTAVARSAEAMTVIAVLTAGLFPLIHLGRLWVVYFIFPYPSQRQLWPNFISPLVWDVLAVSTYLTVSSIFFYVGLIPDLASARDRAAKLLGPSHWRSQLYRKLSLGWSGAVSQWRHYGRSYLFFAALATPLVVSVHSVVSWDFAMSILPGWHTTIFAPYFVAGAIHSGLAMVLTLLIPLRAILNLKRVITMDHLESVAKTILVTTCIVGYAYVIESFIAWYSGDEFEQQFAVWRATSGWVAAIYWALFALNVFIPLLLAFKRVRRNIPALLAISLCINLGMWLERVLIVTASTAHDFLPHNWGGYFPTIIEATITIGSFAFFLFWFFGFAKLVPTVAASDVKELIAHDELKEKQGQGTGDQGLGTRDQELRGQSFARSVRGAKSGVLAVFEHPSKLIAALRQAREEGFEQIDAYAPYRIEAAEEFVNRHQSPVRFWTLAGALCGMIGGFSLAIGSAKVNSLIVGGKPSVAVIPFFIVAFEGTILLGAIGNLIGLIVHCHLGRKPLPAWFDPRFTRDRLGVFIACEGARADAATAMLTAQGAQEVRRVG